MGAKIKLVAVVAGACVAGVYVDKFVKGKGWVKPDASYSNYTPAIFAGLAGLGAHMAGLL